ncbi:methylated-DNA--protein-cysteine methyltransferase-like [Dendronephthya gigantea]|uniref:methylated-DNA--protein-cysteine methyltransferase-like n=1 Tax=Dendronephthya gigantea TaxID=151771 RepID=UPI00106C1C7F|nr:methylated-DNA--protein-cysteine methyltransferase-like [Dendronephthya gigantea]
MEEEYIVDSQLGPVRITYNSNGITRIKFTKDAVEISPKSKAVNKNLEIAIKWLETYFENAHETKSMDYPCLDMEAHSGKKFMCTVWKVLKDQVGPGDTISYGELAKLSGSPNAARAVGQAMKNNPFSIIVPCHRVINASGEMGNYSGGVDKKHWLLRHEGKDFDLKDKN